MIETENQNIKRSVKGVVIVVIIIAVLAGALWLFKGGSGSSSEPWGDTKSVHRTEDGSNLPQPTTLKSEALGFEITVPGAVAPVGTFSKFYNLSTKWRVNAPASGAGSKGTALLAIPLIQIDNKGIEPKVYPLYFDAEVRVGISSSTSDCLNKDTPSQKVADITLNGTAFKKFTFGDAATKEYVQGESYRAVHNGLCYAIEQIKVGSTYHEPNAEESLTNEDMDIYYAQAGDVVKSFKFIK